MRGKGTHFGRSGVTVFTMKRRRLIIAAAIALAAAYPAVSMAIMDFVGASGNGNIVTRERTVRSFTEVVSTGSETVRVHRAEECRVTVTCDENLQDAYKARVSGGRLELGFERGFAVRGPVRVTVDVWMPSVKGLTLAGSGEISAEDPFPVRSLDIVISGSGSVSGRFDGGSVAATISGSGNIGLAGSADDLTLRITGSGDFEGRDLAVDRAETVISGSGSVNLGRCESLDAKITGSGDVRYEGNPRLTVSVSGSGTVRPR